MPGENMTYAVKANAFLFSFSHLDIRNADIIKISPTEFNLLKDGRSINASLVEADTSGKKLTIAIEGEVYQVEIADELDQRLEKMGFGAVSGKQVKEIKAPMPGLVLEIGVISGQHVRHGDKLLILEAMKMENSIMIHADATIKNIKVEPGQAVEKGQVLVELE
jgi:biotin carboxyl carrier protein